MKLAIWTPRREGWLCEVAAELARSVEVALVADATAAAAADLRVYDVANQPAYGFVYRALLEEPGLVILENWDLHRLVHGETAGRGDRLGYLAEARRSHGPLGSFIAEQVVRGVPGSLPSLIPLNERVLEASLGLIATSEAVCARARARLGGRPVVHLAPGSCAPPDAAGAIVALARELVPRLPEARHALTERRVLEATALGRAFAELRPFARELGLRDLPADVFPRVSQLFPQN